MLRVHVPTPQLLRSLRGCVIPNNVCIVVYGANESVESARLRTESVTFSPELKQSGDVVVGDAPLLAENVAAVVLKAALKSGEATAVQVAWRQAIQLVARLDQTAMILSEVFVKALNTSNHIATHTANMFISSGIFSPSDTSYACTISSLLEALASGTEPLVSLNPPAFSSLVSSLPPQLIYNPPINLSSMRQQYWPLLVSHMKSFSPNDPIRVNFTAPMSKYSSDFTMDALSTEISITGLTFKTTPLSTSFTPLIDSRNDASRLAMSFLQRYNTSAAATSTHSSTLASASAPIIRLGFTSDLPSVHTEPIPGTYTSALANFCRATGKEEPEYTFKELDAGLGYSACVKVAKTEFWGDSNVVIGKKNIAKEHAAKQACEALSIPLPISANPVMQPARPQIPQKIATSTNDMSLLNNFCQRNKVSLSVTYTELNPSRFTCRVAIEKFGTWDSRKAYRHKWEAKSCAAEVACVGVGLKKESDVTRPIVQQVVSVSKTSVPKVHGLPPRPIPLPPKPTSTMASSSTAIPSTQSAAPLKRKRETEPSVTFLPPPAIQQLPINLQQPSLTAPTTFPYHMIHFGSPGMSQIPYMAYPQAFGSSMNPIQQQYFQSYVQWPQNNQPETKNDE